MGVATASRGSAIGQDGQRSEVSLTIAVTGTAAATVTAVTAAAVTTAVTAVNTSAAAAITAASAQGQRSEVGLTVAEVAALRTVLPHEGSPPLAEAQTGPGVTHPLLVKATWGQRSGVRG